MLNIESMITKRALINTERTLASQEEKGMTKYGELVDNTIHSGRYDWLKMMQEEIADALVYIQAEREARESAYINLSGELYEIVQSLDNVPGTELQREKLFEISNKLAAFYNTHGNRKS